MFGSVSALDLSRSLVPLSLLFLLLCFFPCQRLELPQNSQAAHIQRKSFLGLIHARIHTLKPRHTHKLPRQICPPLIRPPTDILFVSCSSTSPSDEHIKRGQHGVNRRAVSEKTARKHKELQKNNDNSCQFLSVGSLAHIFIPSHLVPVFLFFPIFGTC